MDIRKCTHRRSSHWRWTARNEGTVKVCSLNLSFPFPDTSLMCVILCSFSLASLCLHIMVAECLANWNLMDLGPWRSCWFCRHFILIPSWHRCLGLRRCLGCFMLFECIRHLSYRHRDRWDGHRGTLEAASNTCVKAHTGWIRKRLSD